MSNEIVVVAPKDFNETQALSKQLSASALMPMALRKKPEDVMAIVMAGAELGLPPMTAIRGLNIINGKISMVAELMGGLVKKSPVCEFLQLVESSDKLATYRTKRRGEPETTSITFTIDEAKRAGLLSNANWQKYPPAMLRARALSAICRAVYPDLCMGLYDPDEIEAPKPESNSLKDQIRSQIKGEVIEGEVVPSPAPTLPERIVAATSTEDLDALRGEIGALDAVARAAVKDAYLSRYTELSPKEN